MKKIMDIIDIFLFWLILISIPTNLIAFIWTLNIIHLKIVLTSIILFIFFSIKFNVIKHKNKYYENR